MNRRIIVVGVALTAFVVFADQDRTQETGEDEGVDEPSNISLESASNTSTITQTPAVPPGMSMRKGRSKGIIFVPSKEMRTLPKVFLTAGIAKQTQLKGGGGGWGQGGGGGGGWGGGGNGGWGNGGGGGGWGGGGGGGWGWGPPPGWGSGGGGGHDGGWCKPRPKAPSPKRAMKAAMKAQQALMKAQRVAAKANAKAAMAAGWGSHDDLGGDWGQSSGGNGGGGWRGNGKGGKGWGGNGGNNGGWGGGGGGKGGGGGGGWRNSDGSNNNAGGGGDWHAEVDNNEIVLGPPQLHTPIVTEDFSTESEIEDDEWLNSQRGSRIIVGASEPRTFDMLENPLPILFGGELPGGRSFYGRSGFPEGKDAQTEMASAPPKTYHIRTRGRSRNRLDNHSPASDKSQLKQDPIIK